MLDILLSSWTIFFVLLSPLLYWYLTKNNDYFTKKGIKGPKPYLLIGNIHNHALYSSSELDEKWQNEYGKLYGYFQCMRPVLRVADPELIRQLLVKDFDKFRDRYTLGNVEHNIFDQTLVFVKGEQWRHIRSISSTAFTSSKIRLMSNKIQLCVVDLIDHLSKQADEHCEFEAKKTSLAFTQQVIASCLFATKINFMAKTDHPFIKNAQGLSKLNPLKLLAIFALPKCVNKLLGVTCVVNQAPLQFFCDLASKIISERKMNKVDSNKFNDLLASLINADIEQDGGGDENDQVQYDYNQDVYDEHLPEGNTKSHTRLTDDQIVAQAVIFLLAGFETTAATLSWALYELALNPEIQDRLYSEVSTVGHIDGESTARLDYLDAVVSETLRLHPPSTGTVRECNEECKLDNTDITLSKGLHLEFSFYAIHINQEFYSEPKCFNPMRFMPENRHLIKPYTYLPFGAGPRNCVGMRFALVELKIVLARLVTNFQFTKAAKTECKPKLSRQPFNNTPQRLILGISKRA